LRCEIFVYKFLARPMGHSLPLISFSKVQTLHSFKDNIVPKNTIIQSLSKAVWSASQRSTTASAASDSVMTRNMTKAVATAITEDQLIMAAPSQSHKIQNIGSKVSAGVNQIASNVLKQKSIVGFIIPQIIKHGMDELQTHTNCTF